jgi:DSF synthase
VLLIRARDHESLRLYGRRCVDLLWWMETAPQLGVHTTVLVQGDTLGAASSRSCPSTR